MSSLHQVTPVKKLVAAHVTIFSNMASHVTNVLLFLVTA